MERFTKQPYEEFRVTTDFADNFSLGETILSQAVTATDRFGADVSTTVLDQSSVTNDNISKVSVLVRAGDESHSPYKITFRCVTSIGHKWEFDNQMRVKEI